MTKENKLGDTSKLYLTLHEMNSLLLENFKLVWVGGRKFYRVKRDKEVWGESRVGFVFGKLPFWSSAAFRRDKTLTC